MHRELVIRAMSGEHDAFSELVRHVLGKLYVTARLILRDSELAEDAVQEAPIVAYVIRSRSTGPLPRPPPLLRDVPDGAG